MALERGRRFLESLFQSTTSVVVDFDSEIQKPGPTISTYLTTIFNNLDVAWLTGLPHVDKAANSMASDLYPSETLPLLSVTTRDFLTKDHGVDKGLRLNLTKTDVEGRVIVSLQTPSRRVYFNINKIQGLIIWGFSITDGQVWTDQEESLNPEVFEDLSTLASIARGDTKITMV